MPAPDRLVAGLIGRVADTPDMVIGGVVMNAYNQECEQKIWWLGTSDWLVIYGWTERASVSLPC